MGWLHRLARLGNLGELEEALERGEDPNTVSQDGWTPLLLAAREGNEKVVERLLMAGADLHIPHPHGRSALHFAARNGHMGVVARLVAAGMPVDARTRFGVTALLEAARGNHPEVVEELIRLGADATIRDAKGKSASDWLACGGEIGNIEARFASLRGPLIDGRYTAGPAEIESLARLMSEYPDPEEWAAHRGGNVLIFSYAASRYEDPVMQAWAQRVWEILQDRERLSQCEERFLRGNELAEARTRREKAHRIELREERKRRRQLQAPKN